MARALHGVVIGWTAIAVAVVVAACSAVGGSPTGGTGKPGGSGGAGGSTMGMAGDDGGISFVDAPMTESGPPPSGCDPTCQAAGGTCAAGVCTLSDNTGGIATATQTMLQAGGTADATFKWLYPYDKTVFPRGILSPTLQFDGTAPTAVYVHVSFSGMDYKGYFGPSSPARVSLATPVWQAITEAAKATDTVKVEVTKLSGGAVTGPITESWTIAQGSVRGTIYYETYGSQILGGAGSVGIMKIAPGASQPTPFKSGCGNVCHTASADGSTLVAAQQLGTSAAYDLKNAGATLNVMPNELFAYGGIYPDGSFLISATNFRTWGGQPSRLYGTKTGIPIPTPTWDGVIQNGGTIAFSPDGKFVAFNHEDTGQGRTLATMAYDNTSKTFSALSDVASDPSRTLAWPAFTPDSKWVIYHAGSNPSFETDNNATGDVYMVDLATKTTVRLDALDGYANGVSYLPAADPDLNFAPTVLPEAVGGYFWAVFTSHRSYGNILPSKDSGDQNGKLWVAAIDLSPQAGKDASHPAFYLDGQESVADNLRGFWVLDPCQADGATCSSGDQCCGGYCQSTGDGGTAVCSSTSGGCSAEFDKCNTAADCCNPADLCINGHCSAPAPG